jgi:hypothetical protein
VTLLLHGVVRAAHPASARVVTWQDLAMIVSDWRPPTPRDAVAHLELLSGLVVDGPVVPMRYGITATGEEAVRADVLAATAPRLRGHLDRLDGLVEVQAYLRFNEDDALQAMFDEHASDGGPTTRLSLGEQVAAHLVTWRRARSAALLAPVAAAAHDQVPLPDREHTEERRAFLLPHREVAPARAAITALRHLAGVEAECVGPLPAYNFLTEPAETAPSRWGW